MQSAPSLSVPSFPAFPTSAPTTTARLAPAAPAFAAPRPRTPLMHQFEATHGSASRALGPVVAAGPIVERSSAALGPPRPAAAPLAFKQEPLGVDDYALFRRTAPAPEPGWYAPSAEPTVEPSSLLDFLPAPPQHDPPPPNYLEPTPAYSSYWVPPPPAAPAPRRATYTAPALHLDTALPSFYDVPPAAPHALAHPFSTSTSTSTSSASGSSQQGGTAAAYLASTPLEPLAAAPAASSSFYGGDAGFGCGLGLDLGLGLDFSFVSPHPQPQSQPHDAQPSSASMGPSASASDASAFFSMFRSDPWDGVEEYVVEEQEHGQELGLWEGEGFGGWSG